MADKQLSFRQSANVDHVTDKRKDSLFRLVDTDGSGTIDAQEFAVLYDAIKKDLAEELEKEAALQKEASSARRRVKMLLLFVAVLVSFLAASVAANFAVIFTVVDQAVTTTTTSTGLLEVKGSDMIAKTAVATQDLPLMAAPALEFETLAEVKSLKVTYGNGAGTPTKAQMAVVGVRKHNSTFVEFVTDVPGETVETLNGIASLVRYPTVANGLAKPKKFTICAANATCSAFSARGVDAKATLDLARAALEEIGLSENARRLDPFFSSSSCGTGVWTTSECTGTSSCGGVAAAKVLYYDAYSGTRHVVYMLHGFTETYTDMWNVFCSDGGLCDALTDDAFKHLAFVFPTSSITGVWGSSTGPAWASDLTDVTTFDAGATDLATLMCGGSSWASGNSCSSGGGGWLSSFGIGDASEMMFVGFSNGGAMSIIASFSYADVTKAVAIDFYWYPSGTSTTLNAKIYMSCNGAVYKTTGIFDGVMTSAAGLSADGSAPASYGGLAFQEWSYSSSDRSLKFAVHDLDPADSSVCLGSMTPCLSGSCGAWGVHNAMPDTVKEAAIDDILDWVTPPPGYWGPPGGTGGTGGSTGGSTTPAPSPPVYVSLPTVAVPAPTYSSYGITGPMVAERTTVKEKAYPKLAKSPRFTFSRF